ncbi:MAG: DUF188 domain-containing protein [Oligoflexales bacterium]
MSSKSWKLWIDGDGCPRIIVEIACKAALRRHFRIWMIANKHKNPPPPCEFHIVPTEPDAADDFIAENVEPKDMVITGDILLAERIIKRGGLAIDHRGHEFTEHDIASRVQHRNLSEQLRDAGLIHGGPPPYGEKDKRAFASTFDRLLHVCLKG